MVTKSEKSQPKRLEVRENIATHIAGVVHGTRSFWSRSPVQPIATQARSAKLAPTARDLQLCSQIASSRALLLEADHEVTVDGRAGGRAST